MRSGVVPRAGGTPESAALSRHDVEEERVPHAIHTEEAQNFIGDFESFLAECRPYRLVLTLATRGIETFPKEAASANCATASLCAWAAQRQSGSATKSEPHRLQSVCPDPLRDASEAPDTPSGPTMVATDPWSPEDRTRCRTGAGRGARATNDTPDHTPKWRLNSPRFIMPVGRVERAAQIFTRPETDFEGSIDPAPS